MNSTKRLSPQTINSFIRRTERPDLRKLLNKVTVLVDKGCWIIREDWSQYTTINKEPGHRFMYRIYRKGLTSNRLVCHTCDRPGCINPAHLYQGTPKDNYQDAITRSRIIRPFKRINVTAEELDKWRKEDNERNISAYWNSNRRRFPN